VSAPVDWVADGRPPAPEVWGGLECTVNRVGDRTFDQTVQSGHQQRGSDLDQIAALGLKAVRYPVLWERIAPHGLEAADWSWTDQRLGRLRDLGVRPIATLLHHGSGPAHTSLTDPAFPDQLARFAAAAAARYPHIAEWTPVNEPTTTARFSCLYGHWYPHGRDLRLFVTALLNQCRGTALAMQAIRRVNPAARLVHTDDYGRSYARAPLAYQAAYENERRLLALDLLAGRVDRAHPLWFHLRDAGATEAALGWFQDHPCPPDVIGVNYYVTSDRFLDDRVERYPAALVGGNGRDRYVDREAVRAEEAGVTGHGAILDELWARYRRPLAITEVHLGCTREQQLRWLRDAWQAACELRAVGHDIRAVTAWALLGAFDWDKLVTRCDGHYEPGVFDLRSPAPRPTALAAMVGALARGQRHAHPALDGPGWWRSDHRLLDREPPASPPGAQPILISGAGTLGQAVARVARQRGLAVVLLDRQDLDIADARSVEAAFVRHQPWAVVNAAGYVRVDQAEHEPERCWRENVTGAVTLAAACASARLPLVTFSSDLVFGGGADRPYLESDPTAPLNVYGHSKAAAELRVQELAPGALVVRTAAFFGPWDQANFVTLTLARLRRRAAVLAAEDLVVSPSYVPELASATLDLLIDGECGVWHLTNQGALSWAELARAAAVAEGLDPALVQGVPAESLGLRAPRPRWSALASERGHLMRPLGDALQEFMQDRVDGRRAA
jgi:dTDP-4-dehydrorhamnose reductase